MNNRFALLFRFILLGVHCAPCDFFLSFVGAESLSHDTTVYCSLVVRTLFALTTIFPKKSEERKLLLRVVFCSQMETAN